GLAAAVDIVPTLRSVGHCREHPAEELIQVLVVVDPADDGHDVVIPVDVDDVDAVALESHGPAWRRREWQRPGGAVRAWLREIEVPVAVAVRRVGRPGCPCHTDPLL